MGHATHANLQSIQADFEPILVDGEHLLSAFQLVRDMFVFTNLRLILVDRQGLTGKKIQYQSIPYTSIVMFAKESAGLLDLDAELKLWIRGQPTPLVKEFKNDQSVNAIYQLLSRVVLTRTNPQS
jgi:hypothetical protein